MDVKYDVYSLGIMMAVISFLGFLLENTWLAVTKGYIDNRNMNAPFLIGYGLLVVGMYAVLGTPDEMSIFGTYTVTASKRGKILMYFVCSMVIVSISEIVLGTAMEKICKIEYWNYSWIPMHITKYTSVPTSIGFAAVITLFMGKCFDPIMSVICSIDTEGAKRASIVLVAIMAVDCAYSFRQMYKTHSLNVKWQKQLKHSLIRTA